ncbi:hypothetical protein [Nostoc sp. UHCC 0870]|uniref:hypothetical protein n=1 Tax=Nostoc sp. UHCC 0870 TaxID=2914041 RepID=UPI001EDF04A8|nr:hypothetical protein [Nostoc sp. UHCC 0870]UKP00920.1 hypothetical protein L6494_26885 [Nostoc sp. UHCC 0870]
MNEADTSNNRTVMESPNSSANSLQTEQTICPFYSVVPADNTVVAKLPLLNPAADEQHHPQTPDFPQDTTNHKDWVVEPDSDQQTQVGDEFHKLLALNEELRAANNNLYQQVEHLKDDLAESEQALQWQKRRSSVTESMLNQQAQELSAAQEQIQSLFQQLETTSQTAQRQEILNDSYKAQLQISQQRIAQLERECALLQTDYSEQSQQVLQSENSCRELRTRLMRQQRQTLQFKAALEKCLETSIPSYDAPDTATEKPQNPVTHKSRFTKKARSLFPNAQPIKPWSAEPETPEENTAQVESEASLPPPFSGDYGVPNPSPVWNWPAKPEASPASKPSASSDAIENEPLIHPEDISSVTPSLELDEQIDSLIQMFFASQPGTKSATPPTSDPLPDSQPVETQVWETWATDVEDDETPETTPEKPLVTFTDITLPTNNSATLSFTLSPTENPAEPPENSYSQVSPVNESELELSDLSHELLGDFTDEETQSPSPVVYPQRPPKKRKSLASVELPNFKQNIQ